MKYKKIFEKSMLGGIPLKNKLIMSPMDMNAAPLDGSLSRKMYHYFLERAMGGCGLIIVEGMTVDWPYGKGCERQFNMTDYTVSSDWYDLTQSVHAQDCRIICQLYHAGFLAYPEYCNGAENISASNTYDLEGWPDAREITKQEIIELKDKFIHAALVAKQSGFDGVEVHCAHSYILNQFLSPLINKRNDEYGGTLENRTRLVREIIEGIKEQCGSPFIISARIPAAEYIDGGLSDEECIEIAKIIEKAGAHLLNVSVGIVPSVECEVESQWDCEGKRIHLAEKIKAHIKDAKIAIAGKIRQAQMCEDILVNKKADYVALGRPFLADPQWANKVLFNKEDEIRPCLNCHDGCLGAYFNHGNIHCSINPYLGFEDVFRESESYIKKQKTVLVVGGGIAGLQAGIIASKCGHRVILFEKENCLGGQINIASVPPHKEDLAKNLLWFIEEAKRENIEIHLNTEATLERVNQLKPHVVLFATGSEPSTPPIKGIENTISSWSILDGRISTPSGKSIAIIGGGTVGCELAHLLIEKGNQVRIIERLNSLCQGQEMTHRLLLTTFLSEHAAIDLSASVSSISENSVTFTDQEMKEKTCTCDMVITATGQKPFGDVLYQELIDQSIQVYKIGDCLKVGNIRHATRAAFDVAMRI